MLGCEDFVLPGVVKTRLANAPPWSQRSMIKLILRLCKSNTSRRRSANLMPQAQIVDIELPFFRALFPDELKEEKPIISCICASSGLISSIVNDIINAIASKCNGRSDGRSLSGKDQVHGRREKSLLFCWELQMKLVFLACLFYASVVRRVWERASVFSEITALQAVLMQSP